MVDDLADVGEEADAGARDDLLHRFDQRPADQVVRLDLGGDPSGLQRRLLGLGDDLEVAGVPVGADVVHQRGSSSRGSPRSLQPTWRTPRVRDRRINLTRVGEGLIVPRQHEDEFAHVHPALLLKLSDNSLL